MNEQDKNDINKNNSSSGSDVELDLCKKQAEEYLNNWKRERADFVNYKKDETKRMSEFIKFANEALVLDMIEVLDDLELAQGIGQSDRVKNSGLDQIIKKFEDLLKKYGVEKIDIEGETFDANLHEQVFADSGEPLPPGVSMAGNIQKVRNGYTMNGRVIRVARVRMLGSKQ